MNQVGVRVDECSKKAVFLMNSLVNARLVVACVMQGSKLS